MSSKDTGQLNCGPTDTQESPDTKPWRDESILRELYHGRGQTTREIADELGCTNGTVSTWLDKHDIETRENWTAGVEAAKRVNRVEYVQQRTLPAGYEYWASKEGEDRTNEIVYVHRLLAVAEYGFDAVADADVHHENGIQWDNRPANIRPIDKADHTRSHNSNRYTDEELLDEIRAVADAVGGRPVCRDLQDHGDVCPQTIIRRFDSWANAIEAAGVGEPDPDDSAVESDETRQTTLIADGGVVQTSPDPEPVAADLTAFQRDVLVELAKSQVSPEQTYGLRLKERVGEYYGREISHAQIYTNLDKLVDRGLVEKGDIDRRTHSYELTDAGYDVLVSHHDRLASAINEVSGQTIPLAGGDD
ncbi:HNH endonuclease [Halorientalis persicus]|uniref:HNH endonuclease n=1 Tax=Halorientalis persicus TaxID=1367881 RepID=A0A1H8S2R4_9EURY|nr:helix-turn-helix transcriptional regulator [Halorientalis persicus]SEO72827.1 HNH endonuclease [Halorientalis persicus]